MTGQVCESERGWRALRRGVTARARSAPASQPCPCACWTWRASQLLKDKGLREQSESGTDKHESIACRLRGLVAMPGHPHAAMPPLSQLRKASTSGSDHRLSGTILSHD